MRIFDVDFSIKHIAFQTNEKHYLVSFRYSRLKGIYNVRVTECEEGSFIYTDSEVKIEDTFPPFWRQMRELVPLVIHQIRSH